MCTSTHHFAEVRRIELASLQRTKTYICGLVSSILPYIIDHAGEEVEAGRDVMREQQDAQSLQRQHTDKWESWREKGIIIKQTNNALLCYLFPVAADLPPAPSDKSSHPFSASTSPSKQQDLQGIYSVAAKLRPRPVLMPKAPRSAWTPLCCLSQGASPGTETQHRLSWLRLVLCPYGKGVKSLISLNLTLNSKQLPRAEQPAIMALLGSCSLWT